MATLPATVVTGRPASGRAPVGPAVPRRPQSGEPSTLSRTTPGWRMPLLLLLLAGLCSWWGAWLPPLVYEALVTPLAWCMPAAVVVWRMHRRGHSVPLAVAPTTVGIGAGLAQVGVVIGAGLLTGFAASPASRSLPGMAVNVWFGLTALGGREVLRWALVQGLLPHGSRRALVGGWMVPLVVALSPLAIPLHGGTAVLYAYIGYVAIPAAAASLFAAAAALEHGPLPGIGFALPPLLLEWCAPVLPSPPWALVAVISAAASLVAIALLPAHDHGPSQAATPAAGAAPRRRDRRGRVVTTVTALMVVAWFNWGLLGVQPDVLSGISMEPGMHTGDIVITVPVNPAQLRVGDVISFREPSVGLVIHRIVAVHHTAAGPVFTTRGDNNAFDDPPVPAAAVNGELALRIPAIGMPAVWVKQAVSGLLSL